MKSNHIYSIFSNKGVTLIELMVTLAITGVVMTGIVSTFMSQHDSYKVQIQVAALQQNLRTGMKMLSDDIRMAGCYTSSDKHSYTGYVDWDPTRSGADDFRPLIHGVNNIKGITKYRHGTDLIMIVKAGDDRGILVSGEEIPLGSNRLEIGNLDLDDDGDEDLNDGGRKFGIVVKSDLSRAQLFRIANADDKVVADDFQSTFAKGDLIARADIIIYRVDDKNTSFKGSVLERKNVGNGNSFQVVAEDITDMQFSYVLDNGNEISDPSSHEAQIRGVKITLKGEIKIPGKGVRTRTLNSMVTIRNLISNW